MTGVGGDFGGFLPYLQNYRLMYRLIGTIEENTVAGSNTAERLA